MRFFYTGKMTCLYWIRVQSLRLVDMFHFEWSWWPQSRHLGCLPLCEWTPLPQLLVCWPEVGMLISDLLWWIQTSDLVSHCLKTSTATPSTATRSWYSDHTQKLGHLENTRHTALQIKLNNIGSYINKKFVIKFFFASNVGSQMFTQQDCNVTMRLPCWTLTVCQFLSVIWQFGSKVGSHTFGPSGKGCAKFMCCFCKKCLIWLMMRTIWCPSTLFLHDDGISWEPEHHCGSVIFKWEGDTALIGTLRLLDRIALLVEISSSTNNLGADLI